MVLATLIVGSSLILVLVDSQGGYQRVPPPPPPPPPGPWRPGGPGDRGPPFPPPSPPPGQGGFPSPPNRNCCGQSSYPTSRPSPGLTTTTKAPTAGVFTALPSTSPITRPPLGTLTFRPVITARPTSSGVFPSLPPNSITTRHV